MEGDRGGTTAVLYGCRSEVGADRAPADDWSSSAAIVRGSIAETLAITREEKHGSCRRVGEAEGLTDLRLQVVKWRPPCWPRAAESPTAARRQI
jgi:hypothetical protein